MPTAPKSPAEMARTIRALASSVRGFDNLELLLAQWKADLQVEASADMAIDIATGLKNKEKAPSR